MLFDECVICYKELRPPLLVSKVCTNNHYFHYNRIQTWLSHNKCCPTCRQSIDVEEFLLSNNNSVLSPKNAVIQACDNYLNYFNGQAKGIFNHHGKTGRRKVQRLKEILEAVNDGDLRGVQQAVRVFFRNELKDINGHNIKSPNNCNPHSFISFYLSIVMSNSYLVKKLLPEIMHDFAANLSRREGKIDFTLSTSHSSFRNMAVLKLRDLGVIDQQTYMIGRNLVNRNRPRR